MGLRPVETGRPGGVRLAGSGVVPREECPHFEVFGGVQAVNRFMAECSSTPDEDAEPDAAADGGA